MLLHQPSLTWQTGETDTEHEEIQTSGGKDQAKVVRQRDYAGPRLANQKHKPENEMPLALIRATEENAADWSAELIRSRTAPPWLVTN